VAAHGTVVITNAATGAYTYTPNAGYTGADSFNYTLTDGDGDVATATANITISGPAISASQTSSISEEGLAGGIADSLGTSDVTNSATSTAQFTVSGATSVTLGLPTVAYTSGGSAITWALSNGNQTLTGTAAGQTVMTVAIDNTGKYTTTLLKPIDHPVTTTEDVRIVPITVTASNGTASATSTLNVSVEDDSPFASNTTTSVTLPNVNTNIELILDVSGSMGTADAGGGKTRLQLMKESVGQLLDGYDNLGEIRVRIVTFSDTAAQQGGTWVDIATAKTIINGLTANGATNYDAAIVTAQTAFNSSGKISGAQNVSYFLSDGQPNPASSQIDPPEEATWTNFLATNDIKSFAFGMGTGATQGNLNPIAYNGLDNVDTNGVVVSDITQLPPVLRDSVVSPSLGNVVTGGLSGFGFGADGAGNIDTLTIDGTTYTYNPAGAGAVTVSGTNRSVFETADNTLTINTLKGGKFVINLDSGDYNYTASPTISSQQQESVGFSVRDRDGDGATAQLTINVNPPPAAPPVAVNVITVSSPTQVEGTSLSYSVSLSLMTSGTTTFAYALGGGTAAATDYGTPAFSNGVTLNAGILTVPSGVSSFTVTLPTTVDTVDETNETIPLTIGGVTGTGTITDNDGPGISIDNVTVNEGAGTASFTVTLSAASVQPITVDYSTSNNSATAPGDYTAIAATTLTFAPGETSKTITVSITDDSVVESNENFRVDLSNATNASITDNRGTGTIIDNDTPVTPTLSVSNPTVAEAAGFAVFTVSLSNTSATATTFNLALANGTATGSGTDYGSGTATNLQISTDGGTTWTNATAATIAAGQTSVQVRTPITQDTLDEVNETFTLTATRTAGTTTNASAVGTATITDDDATPTISINDVSVNESAGTASFTVTLSAASGQTVSVGYNTSNVEAVAGSDYTSKTGTVTFAPGETTKTITVTIADDALIEVSETFNVNLTTPVNATIADNLGVGTIVDNETSTAARVTLSVADVQHWTFNEASGTTTTNIYPTADQTGTLTDATAGGTNLAPVFTTGHAGTGLQFNGIGQSGSGNSGTRDGGYVALASSVTDPLIGGTSNTGSASLAFWIRTQQVGGTIGWDSPSVIGMENNGGTVDVQWGFINSTGRIGFGMQNIAGVMSANPINDNLWHQVTINHNFSSGATEIWVDGVLSGSGTVAAGVTGLPNKFLGLGVTADDGATTDRYLNATLDDVRIYDRTLTAAQVQSIYTVENNNLGANAVIDNDGGAERFTITATNAISVSVSGAPVGSVIGDGVGGHSVTIASAGQVVDVTGWTHSEMTVRSLGAGVSAMLEVTATGAGTLNTVTEYVNVATAASVFNGTGGTGTAGADYFGPGSGNENISAGGGDDRIYGGAGDDTIDAGAGDNFISGGAGNDNITLGTGANVLKWSLADAGTTVAPAADVVTGFTNASVASGGDILDLRDLLQGENHDTGIGNLSNYLHFEKSGTNTIVHISSTGGFTGGVYVSGKDDQTITLNNIDLTLAGNDQAIILDLLNKKILGVD
jgi:uncharacterized protein YegL